MAKRILFLFPYPQGTAASQRFRFEQYYHALEEKGFTIDKQAFINDKTWSILYKPGHTVAKIAGTLSGYFRRLGKMFSLGKYDYVFVHREAEFFGPPVFEWIIAKVAGKKLIYDFDDAIWIPNTSEHNGFFSKFKFYNNVPKICKMAYKVSCGNDYLRIFAAEYNANGVYNPTTIDTEHHHNKIKDQSGNSFVIGWTGTHSTMQYMDALLPVFKRLEEKYNFTFNVIADRAPDFEIKSLKFTPWKKETEIEDLLQFNVGLMPLVDDKWANGKCGFKALQYMALGIPALVSPVGVNTRIVDDGVNGFICTTPDEWYNALSKLMDDRQLLIDLGANTRKKIEAEYSVHANAANFITLFS
jgi:glycosyltransferase involved in cell wall biosynthesis